MGKGNGNNNGITAVQAIAAAKGTRGLVSQIAANLDVAVNYVYTLQKKFPTFRQAILDEREVQKDHVESRLYNRIDNDDTTAIIFYLKTQAKDRGYVERQEVTGQDGSAININFVWENDKR